MQAAAARSTLFKPTAPLRLKPATRPRAFSRPTIVAQCSPQDLAPLPSYQFTRAPAASARRPPHSTHAFAPGCGPEPPFRTDSEEEHQQLLTVNWSSTAIHSRTSERKDINGGYTWLTHPCPNNPFRSKRDEDAMYVEPTMQQRLLAMQMGLPLYGL